ncbi:MAG: anion transporter [Oscillatoriophycideae cyanobacterium NC_groundwater_1537_Pr4_S-0.65um_50_18]|nr:anion transporter [Oscillatoriophycideae cyanobacterium NC_groundwater_1537_Pr4_S-0.65um_50_18]
MTLLLSIAQYLILAISYLGLALGYLPGLRMNRATIALVGSALLIGLGVLSLEEAWEAIDANTIIFLLSMMVVNANLAYSGFFRLALTTLTRLTRSPLGLITLLTFGSGLLSAFFLNDTIAIIFTPLTLSLTQAFRLNPIPYLLAVAGATNLGSVATISGNPQNILIGSFSKIAYLDFAQALTPVALMGLGVQVGLLWLLYPEVRSVQPLQGEAMLQSWVYKPLFTKTVGITIALLVAFMVGLPLAKSAFVAAALLLVTRRIKPDRILREVDWNLLVMFSGLFVLTRCTQALDLLKFFANWIDSAWGLTWVTVILSNLISNVPAVLVLQPLIRPDDTQSWLLLAASSTLAGNLTLFGSVANLIVAEAAEKQGYQLSFIDHLRFGVPLTIATVGIALLWLK